MTVDEIRFSTHGGNDAMDLLTTVARIYAEAYAEYPYLENENDVLSFERSYQRRVEQSGFQLELATNHDCKPVGFAFGHSLRQDTNWWKGLVSSPLGDTAREYEGRTFAIIELVVKAEYRRKGIASALHRRLLMNRTEERVTLLSRPEATAAEIAYQNWGYRIVGQLRPEEKAPIYNARLRGLPFEDATR